MRYNYDFGAKTRVEGPPPQNQPNGVIQTFVYDGAARIERATTLNNSAYTRYVYGPNYVQSFSTVNTVADEAYAITVFDGVGRAFTTTTNHPGSTGGYKLVNVIYDRMGRAVQSSNPTEVNNSWLPTGDDAEGVRYTQQTYDWKGRPLVTTNTDGMQKYANYSTCGCAGSEVVTLTDEVGRQQKVYSDVLGRTWKTEILNWDSSVYSSVTNTFDARDQVMLVRQFQGAEGSAVYQDTTMGYDGYGRLQSKHVPEQNAGAATLYAYNSDDTLQSVTDARGASATHSYNGRHLVTSISYSAPAGVTATSNVTFGYDAAGNRTLMTDGTGSVIYHFDQLSRISSETRTFSGLAGQSFALSYVYNLAGQLTSLTEPSQFGASVSYGYDASGRLNNLTGAGFAGGVSQFASNMKYRAWGAIKEVDYGNGLKLSNSFNSRLQPTSYQVKVPNTPAGQGERARSEYGYAPDGRIGQATDVTDGNFNRGYLYDHVGRLIGASTSSAAYFQSFSYDEFSNMTVRGNGSWRFNNTTLMQYANNRNTSTTVYPPGGQPQTSYWGYDAEGNVTSDHNKEYSYDAAGSTRLVFENTGTRFLWLHQDYDADGERVKRLEQANYTYAPSTSVTSYYLRSSVLNSQVINELDQNGQKRQSYVHAGGMTIAQQKDNQVQWVHVDPVTGSLRETGTDGNLGLRSEFDPIGNDAPLTDPAPPDNPSPDYLYPGTYSGSGNPYDSASGCTLDGQPMDCSMVTRLLNMGVADPCRDNRCGPRSVTDAEGNHVGWRIFLGSGWWASNGEANEDGSSGYVFFDDVQYGTALDAYAAFFQEPDKKSGTRKPERRKRRTRPTSVGHLGGRSGVEAGLGPTAPIDSLGVYPTLVSIRCAHLRELLNREAKHGTVNAAKMSSNAFGRPRSGVLYGLLNRYGQMVVNGAPIDQDWLVDLKLFGHGSPARATNAYRIGKTAWWAINEGPGGRRVSPPYEDEGERNAINLAGSWKKFSEIFDQRLMRKICPGY